jgi:peptidoglycan/LPS O-acetylase OafA/YrhL
VKYPITETIETRILVLDGWRAISVSLVIGTHLALYSSIALNSSFRFTNPWGNLGVQIFFVISGFVICRGFLREQMDYKRISIAAFYVRRFLRIIPPLWVYLIAILLLSFGGLVNYNNSYLISNLTFVCNIAKETGCGGWVVTHLWSLSVEEQFYILFPFLFIIFGRSGKRLFGAGAVVLPAVVLVSMALHFSRLANFLYEFLFINMGVFCAQYEAEISKFCLRLPRVTPLVLFIVLICLVPLLGPNRISALISRLAIPGLIALMMMSSISRDSAFCRFLSLPLLVSFGQVSYGLYLWQQLATNAFIGAGYGFYAVSIVACVAVVYFSYYWIESPLIRYGKKMSQKLKASLGKAVA